MKTFFLVLSIALLVAISGCDQTSRNQNTNISSTVKQEVSVSEVILYSGSTAATRNTNSANSKCTRRSLWIPKEATYEIPGKLKLIGRNQYKIPGSFIIRTPANYRLLAHPLNKKEQEKLVVITTNEGVDTSCECRTTGDCYAYINPNTPEDVECRSEDCTSLDECYLEISSGSVESGEKLVAGGFVNANFEVRLVTSSEEIDNLPEAFPLVFKHDKIHSRLEQLMNRYTDHETYSVNEVSAGVIRAPSDHTFAVLNIAGRAAFLILPSSSVTERAVTSNMLTCNGSRCTLSNDKLSISGPVILGFKNSSI